MSAGKSPDSIPTDADHRGRGRDPDRGDGGFGLEAMETSEGDILHGAALSSIS